MAQISWTRFPHRPTIWRARRVAWQQGHRGHAISGPTCHAAFAHSKHLNIICFRYRGAVQADRLNRLNSEIVIRLQEAGRVAPSSTMLGDHFAIRAAIVNHRSTSEDLDCLYDAVLACGRQLAPDFAVHDS